MKIIEVKEATTVEHEGVRYVRLYCPRTQWARWFRNTVPDYLTAIPTMTRDKLERVYKTKAVEG